MSSPLDPSDPRWPAVERLVDAALDTPPAARATLLRTLSGDDPALVEAATRWLEACEASAHFLEPAATGQRLGGWRLRAELGRGGMGAVYVGERDDGTGPARAAVKVLHATLLADDASVRRFREEQRLLAALDHPAIARVLDAGVRADGLPWFAMALVDGLPIDAWCDGERMTLAERMQLLARVADAVAFAHTRQVLHRDLKPSNVLIDGTGAPHLIDFGVAKAMGADAATALTTTGRGAPYTAPFAAPEQVRDAPATVATDVWALGAIGYVLATGAMPFGSGGDDRGALVERIVRGQRVPPSVACRRDRADPWADDAPSPGWAEQVAAARATTPVRLAAQLRGDLDALLLQALAPVATDRPASAAAFASALRAWVANDGGRVRTAAAPRPRVGADAVASAGPSRRAWVATGLLTMGLVAVGGWRVADPPAPPGATAPSTGARSTRLAVAEPQASDPALRPVASAIAWRLLDQLAAAGHTDLVPLGTMLALGRGDDRGPVDDGMLATRVARQTGAGALVTGRVAVLGDTVVLAARLIDPATGALLASIPEVRVARDGVLGGIDTLVARAVPRVAPFLDPRVAPLARVARRAPPLAATQALSQGLEALTANQPLVAERAFAQAAALDSAFVYPRIFLAIARLTSGRFAEGDALLRAIERSPVPRTPLEQALVDNARAWTRGDLRGAWEAARRGAALAPGSAAALAQWAAEARRYGRVREADSILSRIDPEHVDVRGDVWFHVERALVAHLLGDHGRELAIAQEQWRRFPGQPPGRIALVRAFAARGDTARIDSLLLTSGLPPTAPERWRLELEAAVELAAHGGAARARAARVAAALATDPRRVALAAEAWIVAGEPERVRPLLAPMLAAPQPSTAVVGLAALAEQEAGRVAAAESLTTRLPASVAPGDFGGVAYWQGALAAARGDSTAGAALVAQAMRDGLRYGPWAHRAVELTALRQHAAGRRVLTPR